MMPTVKFLKSYLFLFALIFGQVFYYQNSLASDVDCSDGSCQYDNTIIVSNISGNSLYSTLWINSFIDSLFSIFTPPGDVPRDNKIFIRNGVSSKNLSINLSSSVNSTNGGNASIITDVFNIINIDSSGSSGNNGKSSTQLCADNFKTNYYGANSLTYWNSRDGSLDQNNCVSEDIDYLDTKFTCPSGFEEKSNGLVSVTRIEQKKKCSALYNQTRCLKRTYDVNCKMNIVRKVCSDQIYSLEDHPEYYVSPSTISVYNSSECISLPNGYKFSGETISTTFRVTEQNINSFNTQEDLCNSLVNNRANFVAYYDYNWVNNGVPQTDHVTAYPSAVSFTDVPTNAFIFPLPDSAIDSHGDIIAKTDMRVIMRTPQSGKNFSFYDGRPTALTAYSGPFYSGTLMTEDGQNDSKLIANCIGLNGSSANDFLCTRLPGSAYTLYYRILDKYGAFSNELSFTVPATRTRYLYMWVFEHNTNLYSDSAELLTTKRIHGSDITYSTHTIAYGYPNVFFDYYHYSGHPGSTDSGSSGGGWFGLWPGGGSDYFLYASWLEYY